MPILISWPCDKIPVDYFQYKINIYILIASAFNLIFAEASLNSQEVFVQMELIAVGTAGTLFRILGALGTALGRAAL